MSNKRGPAAGTEEAKRGGQAVRAKYGPDFYSRIGKKGGDTVKQRRGPECCLSDNFYASKP